MTESAGQLESLISAMVAAYAAVPGKRINLNTRLWHDLKLSGEDFADLIDDLHRTYGVTLRGIQEEYCPTEAILFWQFWRWPSPAKNQSYRELTVGDLVRSARLRIHVG